jgi:hypothetical protein
LVTTTVAEPVGAFSGGGVVKLPPALPLVLEETL